MRETKRKRERVLAVCKPQKYWNRTIILRIKFILEFNRELKSRFSEKKLTPAKPTSTNCPVFSNFTKGTKTCHPVSSYTSSRTFRSGFDYKIPSCARWMLESFKMIIDRSPLRLLDLQQPSFSQPMPQFFSQFDFHSQSFAFMFFCKLSLLTPLKDEQEAEQVFYFLSLLGCSRVHW